MIELDLVSVPAGKLQQGTRIDDVGSVYLAHLDLDVERGYFLKEVPRHQVEVAAFHLLRTPVTWSQWYEVLPEMRRRSSRPDEPTDHPVDGVSFPMAVRFCERASDLTGQLVRLPTESEWERACRGDDGREYPWGSSYGTGLANLRDLGHGRTLPVGSFPDGASPYGPLDMAGNVDEWTSTPYAPYPGAPGEVPTVESWAVDPHVTRGGDWLHGRDLARCARRHAVYPPRPGAGFRVASGSDG
jgi:formylglycine-generating enzyme required for sulfatase activity